MSKSKSRSFSIYLLKQGFDASNALKDDNTLDSQVAASDLPEGASLFVLDNQPREPWWKSYFGVQKPLSQVTKGALIFLPVGKRCFALSFGHVFHNLKDTSYEYDFGLRVTLNSVDPNKLKSTDVLEPGAARRQRTQVPVDSDLTYFDFDRDSTILKSLTGKVKDEYKGLFRHATGASNLRISTAVTPDGLIDLCKQLLKLYRSEAYKKTFPDIQNIAPVRDPSLIAQLDDALLGAFRSKDETLNLTVPDLINYRDNVCATFTGAGQGLVYDDVFVGRYYEYLEARGQKLDGIGINELKKHALQLTDEDGAPRDRFSLFNCLIFDTALQGGAETYHLCEGHWYKVEKDYVAKLEAFLDPLCTYLTLPAYAHKTEGDYNKDVANEKQGFICLDKTSIHPTGQTPVEPCDLYAVEDDHSVFYHVKVSTLSSQLSHLFNQGTNAIELLKLEPESVDKLTNLIGERAADGTVDGLLEPIAQQRFRVVFGIVTHKDQSKKTRNLPLFSRISLMRNMKALQLMSVRASFGFIEDKSAKQDGRKRKRKAKKCNASKAKLKKAA